MADPSVGIALESVSKRFGDAVAVDDVSLEIGEGEFFSMLGPSGCGKTTTLRMIAGFERPDEGRILLQGEDVTSVFSNRRPVNMVFQQYALFPHMSIYDNVVFGLKVKGVPRQEHRARVLDMLRVVELEGLEKRRPRQLSGGQQQRVALARALVLNPDILLLDEPLSNLDAKIRVQVRAEIRKLQKELGITTIYVTHDQEEALSLSDRVAVMRDGRILQVASPKTLYERPVNRFVADFVGTNNFIAGVCRERGPERAAVETALGVLHGRAAEAVGPGARCVIAVRPENVALGGAGENGVDGRITFAAYLGNTLRYDVETARGAVLKVDIRDPWHHELLPAGHAVRVSFPASVALTLPDE